MRTTLSLDDDVAVLLKRAMDTTGKSMKDVVNEALRDALSRRAAPVERQPYRIIPHDSGRCMLGSLDSVAEALAAAEDEDFK